MFPSSFCFDLNQLRKFLSLKSLDVSKNNRTFALEQYIF